MSKQNTLHRLVAIVAVPVNDHSREHLGNAMEEGRFAVAEVHISKMLRDGHAHILGASVGQLDDATGAAAEIDELDARIMRAMCVEGLAILQNREIAIEAARKKQQADGPGKDAQGEMIA